MYLHNDDTVCAPATIPGTGAVSLIRISGPDALAVASSVVKCREGKELDKAPGYTARFGKIYGRDGRLLDEVIATVFRAPHSYTGEDSVEITCHASKYIVDNIMFLLVGAGARTAEPGEFTKRAFINGKMDLAQAEAVADLISARNAAAHRVALNQMRGGFSGELKKMRDSLLNIVSLMELELDFSEEEVEFADRGELNRLLDKVIAHIGRLTDSFRQGNAIRNGIPVAIAGAVNTGKSTLLNALLGEDRAIVSDVKGTTRDTIEETLNIGGLTFRFIDTAGIRETDEEIEKIGISRTFKKISEAEVVLGMVDLTAGESEIEESVGEILSGCDPSCQKIIFILNKADKYFSDSQAENLDLRGRLSLGNKVVSIENTIVSLIANKYITFNGRPAADFVRFFEPVPVGRLSKPSGSPDGKAADISLMDDLFAVMSARNKSGIEELKSLLYKLCKDYMSDTDATLITNVRHFEALSKANECLVRVREGLSAGVPTDLVSQDIREALYHLGSIVGEISTDEVLGNIFRNFCIGK